LIIWFLISLILIVHPSLLLKSVTYDTLILFIHCTRWLFPGISWQFYQELADHCKALECIEQVLQVDNR